MAAQSTTLLPASRPSRSLVLVSGGLLLVWNIVSWRFPFFWDTVLNSKIAHWYLETGFKQLLVPEQYDAGHPPFFSLYLAGVWRLFGRSLALAHVAMLPFLGLLLWQFQKLTCRWLSPKGCVWATILLFCEPTFLTQASMVTPDIALVAFYLLALNALLDRQRFLLAIAMLFMASMSFRGILMVPALFATEIVLAWLGGKRKIDWMKIWPYLPVAFGTMIWLWAHQQAVGWLLSPPPVTYGAHRKLVGIAGIARNAGVMLWRMLDFGRVFLWLMVGIGILLLGYKRVWASAAHRTMLLAAAMPVLVLGMLFIPFSNPVGHRYFLTSYLLLIMLAVGLVELGGWQRRGRLALAAVALGLVTGHLWLYPQGVAQGWDGSLAHVPIYRLEQQMDAYLHTQGMRRDDVCSDFPLLPHPYYTRITDVDDDQGYCNYLEDDGCPWVLVSRINNGYTDAHLADFMYSGNWVLRKGFSWGPIYMRLYQHR